MKVIDTFIFYNEVELLKLRLETLQYTVDKFVICEMSITHSGVWKGFIFPQFIQDLPISIDRIEYVQVCDAPSLDPQHEANRTLLEIFHRNKITDGLRRFGVSNEDIVLISDIDEIPDPRAIRRCPHLLEDAAFVVFCQSHRQYFVNGLSRQFDLSQCWLGSVAVHAKLLTELNPQELRRGGAFPHAGFLWTQGSAENTVYLESGGWHFTYFGGIDSVEVKSRSVAEGKNAHNSNEFHVPLRTYHNWKRGRTEAVSDWIKNLDAFIKPVQPLATAGLWYLPNPIIDSPMDWEWLWWYENTID